jgi:hypothetical protein
MTPEIRDIADWRRQELEHPGMIVPVPLPDLAAYLQKANEEAGPDPRTWPADVEILSAMEMLDDIFQQRRQKLLLAARDNEPPTPKQMYDHEQNAWFGFQRVFQAMDKENQKIVRGAVK